jgi:hypothetical protein
MLQLTCFLLALASTRTSFDPALAPTSSASALSPAAATRGATALIELDPASAHSMASEDGAAWINKAESRFYRWARPGSLVRFDLKTDVLDAPIAAMERELAKNPDRDAWQMVAALKRTVVHGSVDTGAGTLETEVVIECNPTDPLGKKCLDKMKQLVNDFVRGAFESLPLRDPSLVSRGSSVLGAEIEGESVAVTLSGQQPGEETTLLIDRRSTLPSVMQMPDSRLDYSYEEVAPGHFAPTKLEIQSTKAPTRAAEYTYLHVGNLVFPESIRLTQGSQSSRMTFESVRIETHAH